MGSWFLRATQATITRGADTGQGGDRAQELFRKPGPALAGYFESTG